MSIGTAIDVLQSAVQKLKAGFDDFEVDLQKVRKRTLVDRGAISIYTTMTTRFGPSFAGRSRTTLQNRKIVVLFGEKNELVCI